MAFTPEDGTGVADANSLVDIDYADEYHALRGNGAWALLTDPVKQAKLVVATDYVVDVFSGSWAGFPAFAGQGLPFPRIAVVGGPVVSWKGAKDAVCELALAAAKAPLISNATRGKKRVKVGPIDVEYDGDTAVQTKFVSAVMKLAPFLTGYGRSALNAKLIRC